MKGRLNLAATERVINNGPIRVVDRTGTGAIYFGAGNATFTNPDTFRVGTPVQTFTLRHQVVIDTSTVGPTAQHRPTPARP